MSNYYNLKCWFHRCCSLKITLLCTEINSEDSIKYIIVFLVRIPTIRRKTVKPAGAACNEYLIAIRSDSAIRLMRRLSRVVGR